MDADVFEAAHHVLEGRSGHHSLRPANGSGYLLTGLVVCERCGRRLVGTAATGKRYRYPYYVCFSRPRYGTRECPQTASAPRNSKLVSWRVC